jgi:putative transposase
MRATIPWSSHGHYAGLRHDRLLTPHPLYWELGNTPFAREAAYVELVRGGVRTADQAALTEATLARLGGGRWCDFLDTLQKSTERRVVKAKAGRPPSNPNS